MRKPMDNRSATLTLENAKCAFDQLLSELAYYKKQFEVEMNIKNNLYAFILIQGLFPELRDFENNADMSSPGGHEKAIKWLELNLQENSN